MKRARLKSPPFGRSENDIFDDNGRNWLKHAARKGHKGRQELSSLSPDENKFEVSESCESCTSCTSWPIGTAAVVRHE